MENKTLKYITTICFAIIAVWDIVDLIKYFHLFGLNTTAGSTLVHITFLTAVGSIFVVIALLTATPILSTIGFFLWSINTLYNLARIFRGVLFGIHSASFELVIFWVASLALYVLLMIAGIKPKSAKTLGLIATILAVVRLVTQVIRTVIMGQGITATPILRGVLLIAGVLLLGLTYDGFSKKVVVSKATVTQNSNVSAQGIIEDSTVEKLMRLKSFLDEGVITQEEFDEKKKQLLGL